MGFKNAHALYMMTALAMSSEHSDLYGHNQPQRNKTPKPIKKIIPKGMKEFFYGTESIHALNQKNADKKARKKGLII